jgi:hypothetical protein
VAENHHSWLRAANFIDFALSCSVYHPLHH